MKKDGLNTPPPLGGSALLVIFGVLCLTVFSLLSLSTALSQQRLANRALLAVEDYYNADLWAEDVFARLRMGLEVDVVEQEGNVYSYHYHISDRQTLYVELEKSGEDWTVLRWQAEADGGEIDDSLNVWDGGEEIK